MRNPFKKTPKKRGSAHPVDNEKLRARMHAWIEANYPADPDEQALETNRAILELAIEAETDPEAQKAEDVWVLFVVDEDGFVMDQDGEYLVPERLREGNAFAYVTDDIAHAFSQRFEDR